MERAKSLISILVALLLLFSVGMNVHYCTRKPTEDIVKVTVYDTITHYNPIPDDSKLLGYTNVKLPKSVPKLPKSVPKLTESVPNYEQNETGIMRDTGNIGKQNILQYGNNETENIPDNVDVVLPITQNVYRDSTYTAYVSGYQSKLDSIMVYPKTEIITVTGKAKPKRWSVGFQVGYGVNIRGTPQFSPYVGVGISYNLFSF